MNEVKELIDAIANNDTSSAMDIFNSIVSDKVSSAIDARKVEVAQSMFGSVESE